MAEAHTPNDTVNPVKLIGKPLREAQYASNNRNRDSQVLC